METGMTFRRMVWALDYEHSPRTNRSSKMAIKAFTLTLLFVQATFGFAIAQRREIKPNYPPGTLAMDRLEPKCVSILTGATRVEVQRKRYVRATDLVQEGDGFVTLSREADKDASFAARVASLLLEDAPYLSGPSSGVSTDPVYFLRFWKGEDQVRLDIVPTAHLFSVAYQDKPSLSWVYAMGDLYPIFDRLLPLLKSAFPHDDLISSLTLPPKILAPPLPQKNIPARVLKKIAQIKPGMTRADLLKLFETEGGTSSRSYRSYVYREELFIVEKVDNYNISKLVKVSVEFAAPEQKVLWLGGRGYVLRQGNVLPNQAIEQPDDIIIRISKPFLDVYSLD
jgi:hypothetical protein